MEPCPNCPRARSSPPTSPPPPPGGRPPRAGGGGGGPPRGAGRRLDEVRIDDVRLVRPEDPVVVAAELEGLTVERLERRGKYLVWSLGEALLAAHLRMTGMFRLV